MTIENLREGMRVPNYRKLCEILEEPIKGGNAKNAQLKEFERYFSYKKERNAFIITDIYEEPQESKDGRFRYIQLMEPILLNYLSSRENGYEEMSWSQWYKKLGMISGRQYETAECEYILENYGARPYSLHMFKNIAANKLKDALSCSLNNMRKRGLIEYKECWCFIDRYGWGHQATAQNVEYIEKIHHMVMEEMGCENMSAVFLSPKKHEAFMEKTHDIFYRNREWRNVFKVLEITALDTTKYTGIDPQPLKIELNKRLCAAVKEAVRHVADKHMEKGWEIFMSEACEEPRKKFSLPQGFLWNADIFVEELMML